MEKLKKPDSLIFDMDGTLWDNVDTYAMAWTIGMEKTGNDITISREDIIGLMGKEAKAMLNVLVPEWTDQQHDELFDAVSESYIELVPTMKPIIYDDVLQGLELLSKKYDLFLLSNCEKDGLVNFMKHTGTNHLIKDYMEHGMNLKPKHYNLQLLIDKHGLKSPVYIGDTESDSRESSKAGVPFVFVSYGFGLTDNYSIKFDSFSELVTYYINI